MRVTSFRWSILNISPKPFSGKREEERTWAHTGGSVYEFEFLERYWLYPYQHGLALEYSLVLDTFDVVHSQTNLRREYHRESSKHIILAAKRRF